MAMEDANLYHDRSGSITTGGTAQTLLPAKASREGWGLFNNSGDTLVIHLAGDAATDRGIEIQSKTLFESPIGSPPKGTVSIWGPTTGAKFTCWEY